MKNGLKISLTACLFLLLSCSDERHANQSATRSIEVPTPIVLKQSTAGGPGLQVEVDQAKLQLLKALKPMEKVTMKNFILRDGSKVSLSLTIRQLPVTDDAVLYIDGENKGSLKKRLTDLILLAGTVEGDNLSNVYLAITTESVNGFVQANGEMQHFMTGTGGDIRIIIESEDAPNGAFDMPSPDGFCQTPHLPPSQQENLVFNSCTGGLNWWLRPLDLNQRYESTVAVETDNQLFNKFGSYSEVMNYVTALIGAVSVVYERDINVTVSMNYLGIYTTANDPWTTQETLGGSSGDLLSEFQGAWHPSNGGWPVQAGSAHFISGAPLGGGVASVATICNPNLAFAVSSSIHGRIDWPNWTGAPSHLNWDFTVVAHEMGHNFGSEHTHDYAICDIPDYPLDRCWNSPCGLRVCSRGTIMSYCHLLCGGEANIDLEFHQISKIVMRCNAVSESVSNPSCLTPLPPFPDLIVSSISPPSYVPVGGTFSLPFTITNSGSSNLSQGNDRIGFYISSDSVFDTQDLLLRGYGAFQIVIGGNFSDSVSLTVPSSFGLDSQFYIIAVADHTHIIPEENEDNNVLVSTRVTIGTPPPLPDLDFFTIILSTTSVPVGGSFNLSDSVWNRGLGNAGAFAVGYYASSDSMYNSGIDQLLGSRDVPNGLTAGADSFATTNGLVVPPSFGAGSSFRVIVVADHNNTVLESSEANNWLASPPISVTSAPTSLPDLNIASLSTTASSVQPGTTISLTGTLSNLGNAPANAFTVAFYASLDNAFQPQDPPIGTRAVPGLVAGANITAASPITIPSQLTPGSYYIIARADNLSQISESNESNNTAVTITRVTVTSPGPELEQGSGSPSSTDTPPDLFISAISSGRSSVQAGSNFSVADTVRNSGSVSAPSFRVAYYLSTNNSHDTSDTFIGSRTVSSLAGGGKSNLTTTLTMPSSVGTGDYYIIGFADQLLAVSESNEANNTRATASTISVTVPPQTQADLIVPSITASVSTIQAGGSFNLTDTITNQGTANASSFTVSYYASANTAYEASDTLLGSRSIAALATGTSSSNITTSVSVPASLSAGNYFVIARADSASNIAESNESNNTRATASTISVTVPPQALPDLILLEVSTTQSNPVCAGCEIVIHWAVKNVGNAATTSTFQITYYLSTDSIITTSDIQLLRGTFVSPLAPGATQSGNIPVTVSSITPVGTYYLGGIADKDNAVQESNENNNSLVGTFGIQVVP